MNVKDIFDSLNIEYFSIIDYRFLRQTYGDLLARRGIVPRTAIIFLIPYYSGETVNISRYAAAKDYHLYVKEITPIIENCMTRLYPEWKFAVFADHSPIDERHAAAVSGLGMIGKNRLLINEKYGSYVFIAEVITDIPSHIIGAGKPTDIKECEGCGVCTVLCPTGLLREECDSCLSAITQAKGELTQDDIALMRQYNTVWGCDVCQSVCPHNFHPTVTPIDFFRKDLIPELTIETLSEMSADDFSKRAFAWRKRTVPERNLLALYGDKK